MTLTLRIDEALAKTFSLLRELKYQAGSQVLAHGLSSKFPLIRSASLQSLLDRGTENDYAVILRSIDFSSTEELSKIKPHTGRMAEAIDNGLASSDPETRQRALWTIAKMEVSTHFRFLVDAICDPNDPQQLVAIELITLLVKALRPKSHSRDTEVESIRLSLLTELTRGLESYPQHRIQAMFEWWCALAHQDDEILATVIREAESDESYQRLIHHLERSKTKECVELLARSLWGRSGSSRLIALAAKRHDTVFVETLASMCRSLGFTKELTRNLTSSNNQFQFLDDETFYDERISVAAKISLVGLMSLRSTPIDVVLPRMVWLMQRIDLEQESEVAELLKQQRPMNSDIAVIALSDALDSPDIESSVPPPWKQSMRNALESLLEIYSNAGDCLRRGIELFFRDFKCEKLLEKIHDWPVAHLAAYARLSRISDVGFLATLMSELDSQSPQRRQRGVRAVHLYGMDPGVEVLVINKLDDPVDEVRIEAIHAMADASDREQAISLLSPLEIDSNPEINQAAERSLMKLRGER
jgi:hypothetical protein